MMEQCIKCNTVVVKMKMEMQAILMDHVKIISRIQKFVSTTEATSLRADEIKTRQAMDSDQIEEDEVIDLDTEEEYIYQCETCYETFENVRGLEKHLEMNHRKKHVSNDVVELENNASNENEQVSIDENNLESDQNEIEEPEQMINDNFGSDQSEIDEQEAIDDVESLMNEQAIKIEQQEVDAIQRMMCKKTFANEEEFRNHLANDYDMESVMSEASDDSFENVVTSLNGQNHCVEGFPEENVQEINEENLQCEICDKIFGDFKQFLNHFDSFHERGNIVMDIVTANPSERRHSNDLSTLHVTKPEDEAVTESDIVQYQISEKKQRSLFKDIKKVQAKTPFTCEICEKTFTTKGYVNKHKMFVHENIRDLECQYCQKKFSEKSNLDRHIKCVHQGIKDFECEQCQKKFSRKHALKVHIKRFHQE